MSVLFDVENENTRFLLIFRRVLLALAVFICIYFAASTFSILKDNPAYLHDWRVGACIMLTTGAFLLYCIPIIMHTFCVPVLLHIKMVWPVPVFIAGGIWGGMYLAVFLLTLINRGFLWDFSIVFSASFVLFAGRRTFFAISLVAPTIFAFQGLLIWPPAGDTLLLLAGQTLTLFSVTGLVLLFQRLMAERFARNSLVQQLAQRNSELEEAHRQLAQSVAQEQEIAVLRERTRLAREMHDTLGHALVLISVKLEATQRLRERDPERCDRELESTKQIARETMTALRASIANLRSPVLEHERISQALSRAAGEVSRRSNLHVTYTSQIENELFPADLEEALWKVSQEALTNIEKHAHASHVHMCLNRQDEKLILSIHDDGIGLPQAVHQLQPGESLGSGSFDGHYGLQGMRERVEAVGGRIILCSGEGQGTTIEVELPLLSNIAH